MAVLPIQAFKATFDLELTRALDMFCARVGTRVSDEYIQNLFTHLRTIATSGGKRVRPYAAYLGYKGAGGEGEPIQALVALEVFHLFALVHDDIIDRGTLRHGVETLHQAAQKGLPEHHSRERVAEGQALLVGDLLFSWSTETLLTYVPPEHQAACMGVFYDMVDAVVAGQMLDVKLMALPEADEAMVLQKTELKTAQYTFIHPARLGIALAGSTEDAWVEPFGRALGLAFQIQDDLLDIEGTETGKRSLGDVAEGQHTLFTAYLLREGSAQDKEALARCFGKESSREDCEKLKAAFASSGALAYGRSQIDAYFKEAEAALTRAPLSAEAFEAWGTVIERIKHRTK